VILISRIRRICNFIGKYRLNVKDGGNCILVDYWKKSHIVVNAKNSMRDFKQNFFFFVTTTSLKTKKQQATKHLTRREEKGGGDLFHYI
jgi:hypothetical protein